MQINFYKSSQNGLFILDDKLVPAGSITMNIQGDEAVQFYYNDGTPVFEQNILIEDILDEGGSSYQSKSALISANIEFFYSGGVDSLISAVQNSGGSKKHTYTYTTVRPLAGGTTPYSANDVISDALSVLNTLAEDISALAGSGIVITRTHILTNDTGLSGKTLTVHIYSDTPNVTGLSDNGAFTLNATNRLKRRGGIKVLIGNTYLEGSNDWTTIGANLADKKLRYIITTDADFTPSSAQSWIQVSFDIEISNS